MSMHFFGWRINSDSLFIIVPIFFLTFAQLVFFYLKKKKRCNCWWWFVFLIINLEYFAKQRAFKCTNYLCMWPLKSVFVLYLSILGIFLENFQNFQMGDVDWDFQQVTSFSYWCTVLLNNVFPLIIRYHSYWLKTWHFFFKNVTFFE